MFRVKFGLRIPSFPVDGSRGSEFVGQVIRFLRELEGDFDSAWIDDHFVPWAEFQSKATDTLECFTTISYLSGVFKKLDFGSIVLCNSYRNPALLAKMGATLNALTEGRFILGIGAGWKEDEYVAYGYEFPSAAVRIRQLEEGVQIIRKMWTEEATSFQGKYFRIKNAYCNPKPVPPPPIMIGGGGERLTLRVVARHADWWNLPNVTLETYKHKLDILRDHCSREGREPEEISKTLGNMVAIAETEEKAQEIAKRSPFKAKENEAYFIGTSERVKDQIKAFTDIGVEHFILRFLDFPRLEGTKLFAKKVIPHFCNSPKIKLSNNPSKSIVDRGSSPVHEDHTAL